jgi:hypothetical protein
MLGSYGFDAIHPQQSHILQDFYGFNALLRPERSIPPLAQPHGMIKPDKPGFEELLSFLVADVTGIRYQWGPDGPVQHPAEFQQSLEGVRSRRHEVEGIGGLPFGHLGPFQDLFHTEFPLLLKYAGLSGQGAKAAIHGTGVHIDPDVKMDFALITELFSGQTICCFQESIEFLGKSVDAHELQCFVPLDSTSVGSLCQDTCNGFRNSPAHNASTPPMEITISGSVTQFPVHQILTN